jgi:hypothetical protein
MKAADCMVAKCLLRSSWLVVKNACSRTSRFASRDRDDACVMLLRECLLAAVLPRQSGSPFAPARLQPM